MPNYEYHCSNIECECDTFQTHQSIKEDPLKICPYCEEESISRVIHAVPVIINGEPKTIGALADLNRKKFGESYCQEQQLKNREAILKQNEFTGSLPNGVSRDAVVKRKLTNKSVDMSLSRMNHEQKKKYILTGKK